MSHTNNCKPPFPHPVCGETSDRRVTLVRLVCADPSQCQLDRLPPPGKGKGKESTFSKESVGSAFTQTRKGQRAFPTIASSWLLSAQNNIYAKVAYFGIQYFDPLLILFSVPFKRTEWGEVKDVTVRLCDIESDMVLVNSSKWFMLPEWLSVSLC